MEDKFNEEDKKKVIEFINFIAKNARFPEKDKCGVDTAFCIEYFKLLQHMQVSILPKIEKNILEIKKVIEAKDIPPEVPKD